ncbi:unknown [Bacteroides sp. CAG:702]|nr:unknown [Bacteroides sp. CAG:702]
MRIFNYIFLCGTLYPVVNFLFPKKSYTESKFLGISISLPIKMRIFARSNNSRDKKDEIHSYSLRSGCVVDR